MRFSVLEKGHGGANLGHFARINICYDQGLLVSTVSEYLAKRIYDGRSSHKVETAPLSYTVYPHHETLTLRCPGSQ